MRCTRGLTIQGVMIGAYVSDRTAKLRGALTCSNVVFCGATLVFNTLATVISWQRQHSGAIVTCTGTAALIPLSAVSPSAQLGVSARRAAGAMVTLWRDPWSYSGAQSRDI
jgi:hypothetical protein